MAKNALSLEKFRSAMKRANFEDQGNNLWTLFEEDVILEAQWVAERAIVRVETCERFEAPNVEWHIVEGAGALGGLLGVLAKYGY